jgi:Phage integrase, N-terminal SAM-like domain
VFLSHRAVDHRVSASTQNQALNALVFLYRQVLHSDLGDIGEGVQAKRPQRLPVVLSRDEAQGPTPSRLHVIESEKRLAAFSPPAFWPTCSQLRLPSTTVGRPCSLKILSSSA